MPFSRVKSFAPRQIAAVSFGEICVRSKFLRKQNRAFSFLILVFILTLEKAKLLVFI